MTQDDGGGDAELDLEGMAQEDAVEAVVAADPSRDRTLVRDALEYVTSEGVITPSALDAATPVMAQKVSTAKERATETQFELTKARDAAQPVADLSTVAARLDTYEQEVSVLLERADELDARHEALTDRIEDPDSLYAVAEEVRQVVDEAVSIVDTAVLLATDIHEFAGDLDDPESWVNDVQQDCNAVEETVDAIAAVVEALPAEGADAEAGADVDDWDWGDRDVEPAVAWFDATLRTELVALMVADLRAELDDLRTWAERDDDIGDWYAESIADRLDGLEDRQTDLADGLDALARPAWADRFDDRLDDFGSDIADLEPPVDWVEMQATLEAYRPDGVET